ncbi:hypothetical protein FA95DRAFT_1563508 [Auriscalpium vulgare]|uniref:Uncharacterized protein n=1 Tax=Auriscalpium vulgare TaxID=40419 RepID=A0ACB8RGV4_9AGAM|nr:hypothetical protein FA95DRAFT_1563508 [Auriscalpium vulgare]
MAGVTSGDYDNIWAQRRSRPLQQTHPYYAPASDPQPSNTLTASNPSYQSYGYQNYPASTSASSLTQPQSSFVAAPFSYSAPYNDHQQQSSSLYAASAQESVFTPGPAPQIASSSSLYSTAMPESYQDQRMHYSDGSDRRQLFPTLTLPTTADSSSSLPTKFHPPPIHYVQRDEPAARHLEGANKRPRSDDLDNDDGLGEGLGDAAQSALDKLKRACARCKGLKVRCEFRDDQETCERCIKGSHECVIPGRKKRRPPPKREVLLTKIQEQAAQIAELMSQLETVQASDHKTTQLAKELPRDFAHSTLSSPNSGTLTESLGSAEASPFARGHDESLSTSSYAEHDPPVSQESSAWIMQARQKLEAFGGLIGLGGASLSKEHFVEQDFEDDSSGDEDAVVVKDESESEDEAMNTARPSHTAKKLSSIPSEASPYGLMANMSVKKGKARRSGSVVSENSDLGVANEDFFRPSPEVDVGRLSMPGYEVPKLLRKNIITVLEAEKLFKIYFDWMNISLSLLDPVLYTAQQVYWRCPFLFTVICAIASRFDKERPDLYPTAMEYARQDAGAAFLSGEKRVEVVQAYILLSLYPTPGRRWEDDRCWIYLGQGIRIAMDMNLHHPNTAKPRSEQHAREMLNRTRAWLNCFNLDRSMGSQYGKVTVIRNTDYVASRAPVWWNSSVYNMEHFDIHLCAYNAELRVLNDFMMQVYSDPNHPTGLNKEIDLEKLASDTDDKIEQLRMEWFSRLSDTDMNNEQNRFRIGLLKLGYSYARLVALSFGFQHAFGKNSTDENPFLNRCINAASDVVSAMVDDIGRPSQRIYVKHGPDAQSVFVSFSCTFLIKLLQPKYAGYISPLQREEIINTVQRAVDFGGSADISIDDRHGPKLFSRFIGRLLEDVKAQPPGGKRVPRRAAKRTVQPPTAIPEDAQVHVFTQPSPPAAAKGYFAPLPPSRPTTPFDHFAGPADKTQFQNAAGGVMGMDATEFFRAPLPLDSEILESMQSLSALSELQGTMLPGFGWMGQMPPLDYATQYGHVPQPNFR